MAKRPIREKQLRRLRKTLSRTPLPAWIDLVWWLKFQGHADTTGPETRLMLGGKVRSESHIVGRERVSRIIQGQQVDQWEPVFRVQAKLRDKLQVIE